MEIEVLDQRACLLEPPGEAGGESQRTTVRLSAFIADDQPQAPETHTPRGLHHCRGYFSRGYFSRDLFVLNVIRATSPGPRQIGRQGDATSPACRGRHAG